jgi:hypothetical protein
MDADEGGFEAAAAMAAAATAAAAMAAAWSSVGGLPSTTTGLRNL